MSIVARFQHVEVFTAERFSSTLGVADSRAADVNDGANQDRAEADPKRR